MISTRVLGTSSNVSAPARQVWAVTANNLRLTEDDSRRSLLIRLDARCERPEERTGFRVADLRAWTRANRSLLIGACLTLVRAWDVAGQPRYAGPNPPLGSFERWTAVMGGILHTAGVPGFLDNRKTHRDRADADGMSWRAIVGAWWDAHGDAAVTAGDIFPLATELVADKMGDGNERSQKTRFGKLLASHVDRVFDGHRIERAGAVASGDKRGVALYRLAECEAQNQRPASDEMGSGTLRDVGDVSITARWEYSGNNNRESHNTPVRDAGKRPATSHVPHGSGVSGSVPPGLTIRLTQTLLQGADQIAGTISFANRIAQA